MLHFYNLVVYYGYMRKESFRAQVEEAKQQIIDEGLRVEKKVAGDKNRSKQEEINKKMEEQRAAEAIKQEVIKNFAGTNIIETLEEIRDEGILTYDTYRKENRDDIYNLFGLGAGHHKTEKITTEPMNILFDTNTVIAEFDYRFDNGGEYSGFSSGPSRIKITKSNNIFSLQYNSCGLNISSENPSDIINGVARIIAAKQLKEILVI